MRRSGGRLIAGGPCLCVVPMARRHALVTARRLPRAARVIFGAHAPPRMAARGRRRGRGQFGFADWSDADFRDAFTTIISRRGKKNNTYKFAWARFLLDHSHDPGRVLGMYERAGKAADPPDASVPAAAGGQVTYAEIARYFFVYYWPLVCKTRLRQGPVRQPPKVTQAIEKEFDKGAYPQSVDRIIRTQRPRVDRCVEAISRVAFRQVVYRFQKIGDREDRMFYQYAAGPADRAGNRRIDRKGGILVNPEAARFLRENYAVLNGALTVEWLRAIESYNVGSPNLVVRLSGDYGKRNQRKFLRVLEAIGASCFYCGDELVRGRCTHVDHVLPFDYMGDTDLWNLVLACQRCNCEKLCSLPPPRYIDKLVSRNADHAGNGAMAESLDRMGRFERGIKWHYENAKRHGYRVVKALPAARGSGLA